MSDRRCTCPQSLMATTIYFGKLSASTSFKMWQRVSDLGKYLQVSQAGVDGPLTLLPSMTPRSYAAANEWLSATRETFSNHFSLTSAPSTSEPTGCLEEKELRTISNSGKLRGVHGREDGLQVRFTLDASPYANKNCSYSLAKLLYSQLSVHPGDSWLLIVAELRGNIYV